MGPEAEALRQAVLNLIAEFIDESVSRQEQDKLELGNDYDMNRYIAGFSMGEQEACNRLAEMITDMSVRCR